jgi:LCP family protein required for cell wall assembly
MKVQAPPRGQAAGLPDAQMPIMAANSAHYNAPLRQRGRRPWYRRKRLIWPLMYLLVAMATCAALWWNVPVLNVLTGEWQTNGTQVKHFVNNFVQPQASLEVAFSGQRQVHVLLAGLDYVPEKSGEEPPHRSDSVMLAAVDFDTKQVRIVSVPRDSWVEQYMNGVAQGRDKLAHSYTYGGIQRTEETVEQLLGVNADFYVTIQFKGLAQLIDNLGGLTVDVEKNMNYDDRHGNLHIHLKKGV